jgi:uncharacterized protein YbaR (Trm112 family)/SAM-dependent methyltransferase
MSNHDDILRGVEKITAQTMAAKAAEIRFRRDLCRYRINQEPVFDDEFDCETIVHIFRERIAAAIADVSTLPEVSNIASCLEIGAECCQRAAGVSDQLKIPCYAADISLDSLLSFDFYAPLLGVNSRPLRICCDLTVLPFRSNSIDLVFSYQTLHHFRHPESVVAEICRVNRATFFGCDEPTRRHLRLFVGTQPHTIYSPRRTKRRWGRFLEDMFLRSQCNESAYGVIENEDLSLAAWKKCLEPWYECEWYHGAGIAKGARISHRWGGSMKWKWFSLMGTNVSFVGRRSSQPVSVGKSVLVCPDCLQRDGSEELLSLGLSELRCAQCASSFPVVRDIPVLLPTALRRALYPSLKQLAAG